MNRSTLDTLWIVTRKAQAFARDCEEAHCCCPNCLAGTCAITSTYIVRELLSKGFNPWLEMSLSCGSAHCWASIVLDGKPFVIDATAMQFSCGSRNPSIIDALIEPRIEYINRFFIDEIHYGTAPDSVVCKLQNWGEQSPWNYDELVPTLEHLWIPDQKVVGF